MSGPLAGLRVVDFSQIVSGPMAAAMLADQGADVIKVEAPGGDPVRRFGPSKGDISAMFVAVNRGKRGIVLDLKAAAAQDVLWRLIERADVLVENFRPGVMARFGLDAPAVLARNPRLIYASVTGFGADGPYANIRVYDPVIQAVAGLAATQPDADGRPSLIRTLIADKVTALTAAQAITAALYHRERSGHGQHVEVAMLDAALAFNWPDGMYNHSFLDEPPAPYPEYGALNRVRDAADGQVTIGVLQDSEFVALMRALGLDALAADPVLASFGGRIANRKLWEPAMLAALKATDLDTLMAGFIREGAVGGRVNACADVPADPQVMHNRVIAEVGQGDIGRVRTARHAAHFSAAAVPPPKPAPRLGEHSRAVLAELGYDDAAAAALFACGAAR